MYEIIPSTEISHRVDFPLLCNAREIKYAVEVGTDLGGYAKEFMSKFNGDLICVDDYKPYEWITGSRVSDIMMTVVALAAFTGRVRIVLDTSINVASRLPDWLKEQIGFVYIDATHTYESVKSDIDTWWPILNSRGILAGHDYAPCHTPVMDAVNEFAKANNCIIRLTQDTYIPSWYIYKNEPPELCINFFDGKDMQTGTKPNDKY